MVNFCNVVNCNLGDVGTVKSLGSVGVLKGTIMANDVLAIGAPQFVAAGSFNQLVSAIKNTATYVNLHTQNIDGEVRGQIVVDK
jgi:hypothetical protein